MILVIEFYPIRVSRIKSPLTILTMFNDEVGMFVSGTMRFGFFVWGYWLRMGRKQPEQAPLK
jgi:hypothetical protein